MVIRFINFKTSELIGEYECLDTFPIPRSGDIITTSLNEEFRYAVMTVEHNVTTFDVGGNKQMALKSVDIYIEEMWLKLKFYTRLRKDW